MGNTSVNGFGGSGAAKVKLTETERVQEQMNTMITQHNLHLKMFRQQQQDHMASARLAFQQKDMATAKQAFVSYKQLSVQIRSVQNAVNAVQRQQNTLYQQALNDETMQIMRTAARVNAQKPMASLENAIDLSDAAAEVADLTVEMASALAFDTNDGAADDEEWATFCKMFSDAPAPAPLAAPSPAAATIEVRSPPAVPNTTLPVDAYGLPHAPDAALPPPNERPRSPNPKPGADGALSLSISN